ncbi:hypothetical protein Q5O24_04940 [Eubacteriaceae bacterium ES3]|nr:hypothetical protein Q5O24_04940 [Eubacteriaceae bacterium ES3]
MIIITNLTLEQLENPSSLALSRLYERILEKCTPLVFDGENLRDDKRSQNFEHVKKVLGS